MKRKGKAETTVTKTVTTTKRTKKAQEADTNDNNDGAKDQTIETPRKKRAAAKNVKYEGDSDEAIVETTTVFKQTVKQKRTKKKRTKQGVLSYKCSPTSRRPEDDAAEDIKERPPAAVQIPRQDHSARVRPAAGRPALLRRRYCKRRRVFF
jgi:hypothetical protein